MKYLKKIFRQQDKTKEVRRVVSNWYSLVDIPNHAAGLEDGVWDGIFDLGAKSNIS